MDKKIIYIIGAGRSGTTLLDIILGNAPKLLSAGELNRYTKRDGVPHNARDESVSSFWNNIKKQLEDKGLENPYKYYQLSLEFEYHSSVLRMLSCNRKKFECYSNYQQALFTVISKTAKEDFNKDIIVDSSKYPLRAYFLSKIFGKSISFIYIQRHPFSVVESFQRKNVEQPSKNRYAAHTYLLGVNSLSLAVLKRLKKNHDISFVSYEGLLTDPISELSKIETDLLVDLSIPKKRIEANLPLNVGYLFDGNRLRTEEAIVFRKSPPLQFSVKSINYFLEKIHKLVWYKKNSSI